MLPLAGARVDLHRLSVSLLPRGLGVQELYADVNIVCKVEFLTYLGPAQSAR